jgi:serine/threonine protein kinase/tetratricopeptide (TPR) repeat protein
MTSERWSQIKGALASALETDPAQRPAALDRLCGGDADLRGEVEALLAFEAHADAVLNTRAVPGAAPGRPRMEAPPAAIGAYRVLRELGRGGEARPTWDVATLTSERWSQIKGALASALETDPAERPAELDRLCGGDAVLRGEVEALLAFKAHADTLLNTGVAPGAAPGAAPGHLRMEAPPPAAIGAYRVVRELGRGGMGVVYLGERADGQFRKQAAIKLITSGRHDATMQRRFRRERQILAQLEHPGIARLLDGGVTEDGQPYFIMEYIEGQGLLEYCDRKKRSVTERLRLFLKVCDAVAYAHQQLIVHRDLKPGNILVTAQGTPHLLDFGIGQVLGAGEGAEDITQAGFPMMTPAYASPEQARGEPYTVLSDVYSLGVILYELLAGRRPYEVSAVSYIELARVISEQQPVALGQAAGSGTAETAEWRSSTPERLRRSLSGDLERIVAKALSKDARLRYAGVQELADDVRRHLDGRPVKARPATLRYRAGKLLRRHRVLLPAAAAALALILSFAAATWWEARRAERRFQQVRGLAHSVMFELDDAIAKMPGSTAAQELLVRRALEYLQSLARDAGNDAGLQREVALGYERVGMVQGYVSESNLGQVAAALASFQKAEEILGRLSARAPSDRSLRRDVYRVMNELGRTYGVSGQFQKASDIARQSLAQAEAAFRDQPSDIVSMQDLIAANDGVADSLTGEHKYAEAIPLRQRGLELARKLVELQPGLAEAERSLALAEKKLAALLGVSHRYQESRDAYERARAIDERLSMRNPSNMRAKLDLSFDYSDLGWVMARMGTYTEALASHRRALALRQEAAQADPNDFRAATAVASSIMRIGRTLREMGDLDGALAESQRAVVLYAALTRRSKTDVGLVESLSEAHSDIADELVDQAARRGVPPARQQESRARAIAEYRKAIELYEGLRAKGVLPKAREKYIADLKADVEKVNRAAR